MNAITLIIVIEDKMEEQKNALTAIKRSLITDGDEECHYDLGDGAAQLAYKESKVMVWFAPDLAVARSKLDTATHAFKDLLPRRVVITDLMFPADKERREEPNGLSVLADCVKQDLPVVVCSDTDHHDVGYLRDVLPLLGKMHAKGEIPVILDKKDWDRAVVEALRLIDVCTEREVAV